MESDKKRTSIANISPDHGHVIRGGGSAGLGAPGHREGGYPNNCTPSMAQNDHLENAGIPPIWAQIAALIGTDNMLALWSFLDDHPTQLDDRRRLMVPRRSTLERYHRNRLLHQLSLQGLSVTEIQKVLKQHGYNITTSNIYRIAASPVTKGNAGQ